MLRDTVQNIQSDIGKRVYEICLKYAEQGIRAELHRCRSFRGQLPKAEDILASRDIIELKKCIYASQVRTRSSRSLHLSNGTTFLALNSSTYLHTQCQR